MNSARFTLPKTASGGPALANYFGALYGLVLLLE